MSSLSEPQFTHLSGIDQIPHIDEILDALLATGQEIKRNN
jgi:hypothetical protein